MFIVGVWFWKVWKKIMVVRFEVDRFYVIILLLNYLEMFFCIFVEFLSYNEVVVENVEFSFFYEEVFRERLNF